VTAELADWPTDLYASADSKSTTGSISFVDPCLSPFTFEAIDQASPDDYEFTVDGSILGTFTLTKFTVTPDICLDRITYECTNVVGPDDVDFTTTMCNSNFDFTFDGDDADGTLDFSATFDDFSSGAIPAGTYTFTITGTTEDGS
jgi:hypothetical protein